MAHKSDLTSPLYPGSGDPLADLSLARCYTKGKGVEQSYEKAFQHHLKASESGTQRVSLTTQARPLFIIHNNSLSLSLCGMLVSAEQQTRTSSGGLFSGTCDPLEKARLKMRQATTLASFQDFQPLNFYGRQNPRGREVEVPKRVHHVTKSM